MKQFWEKAAVTFSYTYGILHWLHVYFLCLAQYNQPKEVDHILKGAREKFFVEAGAFDGEVYSNSLFFEVERNWTGLLVEPNPEPFKRLQQKGR